MTTTALEMLPATGDPRSWSDQEAALMEAIGVRGTKNVQRNGQWVKEQFQAPRATVEAFLAQCRRTRLDPVARQIYCIERGGKWGIQASIDGFRLIAEWSKEYRGQTPVQWTADGVTWVDVWLDESAPPAAARVGIYRDGFVEPLWAVATYAGYVPKKRDGSPDPTGQWRTNPSNQLAKCAEMLGLRKAFPQDLSGLYGTEEMDQASVTSSRPAPDAAPHVAPKPEPTPAPAPSRDWGALASACRDRDQLRALYGEAEAAQELGLPVGPQDGAPSVKQMFWTLRSKLPDVAPAEEVVEAEIVDPDPSSPTAQVSEWPTVQPGSGGREIDPETGEELI